eukprot:scaffold421288_cov64-Attheya_sp.AAC.1
MATPNPVMFVAKHPFNGNVAQAQLSFPAGATIAARPGQEGNVWWWGSYRGAEGWFPPAYVTALAATPPASMQQRMQTASFAPAQQQARPQQQQQQQPQRPMPAGGMSPQPTNADRFGVTQQPQPAASHPLGGFGVVAPQQPQGMASMVNDPFAGLESTNTMQPITAAAAATTLGTPGPMQSPGPMRSPTSTGGLSTNGSMGSMGSMSPTSVGGSNGSVTQAPYQPQKTQKQMIDEQLGKKKAEEEARQKVEHEARFKRAQEEAARKMQENRDRVAQEAAEKTRAAAGATQGALPMAPQMASPTPAMSPVPTMPSPPQLGQLPTFNPYQFLSGANSTEPMRKFNPIYRVQPYWALLKLDSYIRRFPKVDPEKKGDTAGMYEQLSKALSFICHVVQETERNARVQSGGYGQTNTSESNLSFLKTNYWGCEACIKLISILPHSAGASGATLDGLFLNFINVFVSLVGHLQANQQIVMPGGWQQPNKSTVLLYILRNCGDNKWSFTVCNTGKDGLEYHPSSYDNASGMEQKQLAMTIWDIPYERLTDSTFWCVLFRMQVYPSKRNNAKFLYTQLLPALNARPLLSNMDLGPAEFLEVPDASSAVMFHDLSRLALTTTPMQGARCSKYTSLLVMNAAVDLAYVNIVDARASSMDPEDTRILKLTGRNLANFASTIEPSSVTDGTLGAALSYTWDQLDRLLKKLNFASSKPIDIHSHGVAASTLVDGFSKGSVSTLRAEPGSAAHPFFGRLRQDNYENTVKALMGDPRPDPILIPAVLTDENMPNVATDYMTASSSLRRVCDACSLLMQQRRLVKNGPAFVASAAQYALSIMLPMPNLDATLCFWRKGEMRRETQINLLFLIRRMCRIYQAATACVQQSRGLIAIRSTTFACAACIADGISRVKAVDDPSVFSLHYSGLCEGPTEPFGIEAGSFESLAANLPIYDPLFCSLRFQCLDYLRGLTLKMDGTERPTVFNFDASLTPFGGDFALINQLSIQLALPRPYPATDRASANHSSALISGVNGSIIEVLPEFEYFRDIVFHFKHAVSGKSPTPPNVSEHQMWLPSDGTLKWTTK